MPHRPLRVAANLSDADVSCDDDGYALRSDGIVAKKGTDTDRKTLEELSRLTGGLAHEIKNPLSTIKINLKLISEDLDKNDPKLARPLRKTGDCAEGDRPARADTRRFLALRRPDGIAAADDRP